jgi:hypothetical protein
MCVEEVVRIAIIEGDRDRARRDSSYFKGLDQVTHRQQPHAPGVKKLQVLAELNRGYA